MQRLNVLIKPASSSCNMRCQYCFYEDVSKNRQVKNFGIMKQDIMKGMIDHIFEDKELQIVHFAFQGGEPTLAGIDFFREFISYVKLKQKNIEVSYSIQSNGYSLDNEWFNLFKENEFLVGISLDGFQNNHDMLRFDNQNNGTFSSVIKTIKKLQEMHISYNILTVLTKQLAKSPEKLYTFYKNNKFQYIQFIPCLPRFGCQEDEFSLTPELFYSFYKKLYVLWKEDFLQGRYMSIALFDNIMAICCKESPSQCGFVGQCQIQYVIESQGNVYPCDFYVLDEYCLGNIVKDNLNLMNQHPHAHHFLNNNVLPQKCKECKYLKICYGQCKRQRQSFMNENICGYQRLLDDILKDMIQLVPYFMS